MDMILILSAIASLIQSAFSADCYGDKGQHPDETWAWTIRQSICGDNGCALSDSERGNNAECTLFAQVRNGTVARASRSTTTGQYKHCWDALGNAISQCFRDTSVAYTGKERKTQGNWALDGESYWIQIITGDEFLMPDSNVQSLIGVELDTVDNDPDTPGRDYVYGPQKYCMGFSPGGQSCFDIAEGCFILAPYDNTMPDIICD